MQIIVNVEQEMLQHLDNAQMEHLHNALVRNLGMTTEEQNNSEILPAFIAAKRIEGCSERTLGYYETQLRRVLSATTSQVKHITTTDLRVWLDGYQRGGASKVTVNNVRRILSSFFTWLEEEDIIIKSPMRRIHNIKTGKHVKLPFTDDEVENLRGWSGELRDSAMINLLISSGIRVGELVRLNRKDIDFKNRECLVCGKGDKERKAYFDTRTSLYLQKWLTSRTDEDPALFVTMSKPHVRLQIGGIAGRIKKIGQQLGIEKTHPHRFRRTMATLAINKGMPMEQVQRLLGHEQPGTTQIYAQVNDANVKVSHGRFIG